MKNKFRFTVLFGVMMIVMGVCCIVEKNEQAHFTNLVMSNIDALAGDEDNVSVQCIEDGSIDCRGIRAKYMGEYTRLRK